MLKPFVKSGGTLPPPNQCKHYLEGWCFLMQLDLPKQGERDWYNKFTKALNDVANTLALDGSNRNYTLTNGATKSTDSDSMYVW